ncbi:MAG: UvrD-helicase domain-containing protein [Planctomycetaceae bacterium]
MYKLIRASAGSGKTFQLSGHFLRQLFQGHPPQTVLATTFTRKAAGEILGRVLLRMAAAAADREECQRLADFLAPVDVTQAKALDLLVSVTQQLHRMRVCTLDSFFQQVARSLTLELGLPPGWSIIDEHTDSELRQQATDAVLAQQMPRDAQRLMQMLAKGHSKRSVRDLIDETVQKFHELYLLTGSDAWHRIPHGHRLTLLELEHAVHEVLEQIPPEDKRVEKAVRSDMQRVRDRQWDALIDNGIAKRVFSGDLTYYRKPLPEGLTDAYVPLLTHAKAELLDVMAQQTKATHDLIQRFDREYSRLRSEHGWMSFGDVTRVLAAAEDAADGQRMNFRLDSTLKHLLLDEFQDTSPDQWKVLKRLALKIAASPEESSFFCVGDPKQAIYGWRGGVAEILDAVEVTMPVLESMALDQSRRSSMAVIETVNKVFQHLHLHDNLNDFTRPAFDWEQRFPTHSTVHNELPGFAVLQTSPQFAGDYAAERRIPYYHWVAESIRDLHRQCPGAEIGVLTRKNSTVARLVHELNVLGVPASEEGGTAPTDSPAVLAVLSLLHLASHPGCEVSRFHVATSPLAGVVELTTWTDDDAAAKTAAEIRNRLMDNGYGPTLQWLSESVRAHCNQRDIVRLQQVVAVGWQFDQSPSLNPAEFVRLLEGSRLSKSDSAPVRVMTVHQSKGLEFDIVVLPELDGRLFLTPNAAAGSSVAGEAPDRVCVWRSKAIRSLLPKELQQAFEQTMARDISEALCLLYVALTRAVHALHMLIPPSESGSIPASYAGVLVASLTNDKCAPADHVLYECGNHRWYDAIPEMTAEPQHTMAATADLLPQVSLAPMTERRRGLRREAPSRHEQTHLVLPEAARPSTSVRLSDEIDAAQDLDPKARGTLVHAWFEAIQWLDDGLPDARLLRSMAEGQFVPVHLAEPLLQNFFSFLSNPQTQAALSRTAFLKLANVTSFANNVMSGGAILRVENERPFVLKRDGAIVSGTMDRLVLVVQNGRPVAADVIDFKTDRISGDTGEWVKAKVRQYESQLAEYRIAVQTCFGIAPDRISTRLLLLEADAVVLSRK